MKTVEEYVAWVWLEPEKHVMVVPGVHTMNLLILEGLVEPEQIIDAHSISTYNYPEFKDKTFAFFNYPLCLKMALANNVKDIVDLESTCNSEPITP